MIDDDTVYQMRLTERVAQLWGDERALADATLIESAAAALARISALQPDATAMLDSVEETTRD